MSLMLLRGVDAPLEDDEVELSDGVAPDMVEFSL